MYLFSLYHTKFHKYIFFYKYTIRMHNKLKVCFTPRCCFVVCRLNSGKQMFYAHNVVNKFLKLFRWFSRFYFKNSNFVTITVSHIPTCLRILVYLFCFHFKNIYDVFNFEMRTIILELNIH